MSLNLETRLLLCNHIFILGQLENTETRERKWERERERKLENMETRWAIEPGAASESELLESKAKGSTEC